MLQACLGLARNHCELILVIREPICRVDEVTLASPGRLVPVADVGARLHSNFLRQQRNQASIRRLGEKAFMAGRGVSAT
ncbi:hypothetical protein MES5069_230050 [Mesorhizobium escarrei]|uniref:Uncharacterized protein n=1 Tax=Mesorhizobium escarrei TaxID=666018 RepID=A0ABN8JND4_9HYPH|nr:hypothetical protein MES5069_230050 [Mesorhizobium escarrei]